MNVATPRVSTQNRAQVLDYIWTNTLAYLAIASVMKKEFYNIDTLSREALLKGNAQYS